MIHFAVESGEMQSQRDRFMSLPLPVRLGGLAESLAFATVASDHPKYPKFLTRTLNESVNLIDWTVAAVDPEVQSELAELRSHLTDWLRDAQTIGDDPVKRARVLDSADSGSPVRIVYQHSPASEQSGDDDS